MAKVYFNNIKEVEQYRSAKIGYNVLELYSQCHLLRDLLLPEDECFYRYNRSIPLIRQGDVINIGDKDGNIQPRCYVSGTEYPVITFDEIINSSYPVYDRHKTHEIIPKLSSDRRKELFRNKPYIPNNFFRAITILFSSCISATIGKEHVVDYHVSHTSEYAENLENLLRIKRPSLEKQKEQALEYIYAQQFKTGKRYPVSDEVIEATAKELNSEYDTIIDNIIDEFSIACGKELDIFLNEEPCCRYHFDENEIMFIIERGMDTRIYAWEVERFKKLEEKEEEEGTSVPKLFSYPAFSTDYEIL